MQIQLQGDFFMLQNQIKTIFKRALKKSDSKKELGFFIISIKIFTGKKDVFNVFCNPILTDSISVYTSESYQCILC